MSSISIGLMMLLVIADVIGRFAFDSPVSGAYEITEFLMVIVIFFSITYSELVKGHVTIDIATTRLKQKAQEIISSVMYIFFLATAIVLTWQMWLYSFHVQKSHLVSGVLTIPIYPFVFVATFSCILFTLVIIVNFFSHLKGATGK